MKKLIVVRHGAYDDKKNLSGLGCTQISALAERLKERVAGASVLLLASPTARAYQSAQIIAAALGIEPEVQEILSEDNSASRPAHPIRQAALELLRQRSDQCDVIILVTHYEYAEEFPTYFAGHELGVLIPTQEVGKGRARVVDCESKTASFI